MKSPLLWILPQGTALIARVLGAIIYGETNTHQQSIAYSCGIIAQLQHTLHKDNQETDDCRDIRQTAVAHGLMAVATYGRN